MVIIGAQCVGTEAIGSTQEPHAPKRNPAAWSGPRLVTIPRTMNGFGFTLRHFVVHPPVAAAISDTDVEISGARNVIDIDNTYERRGSLPQLTGTTASLLRAPMETIFVKEVKDGGPACLAGLQVGDRIISVNSENVGSRTYSQVVALIKSSDSSLKLLVVPKDEDILQMAYQSSMQNAAVGGHGSMPADVQWQTFSVADSHAAASWTMPDQTPRRSGVGSNSGSVPGVYKSELYIVSEEQAFRSRQGSNSLPQRPTAESPGRLGLSQPQRAVSSSPQSGPRGLSSSSGSYPTSSSDGRNFTIASGSALSAISTSGSDLRWTTIATSSGGISPTPDSRASVSPVNATKWMWLHSNAGSPPPSSPTFSRTQFDPNPVENLRLTTDVRNGSDIRSESDSVRATEFPSKTMSSSLFWPGESYSAGTKFTVSSETRISSSSTVHLRQMSGGGQPSPSSQNSDVQSTSPLERRRDSYGLTVSLSGANFAVRSSESVPQPRVATRSNTSGPFVGSAADLPQKLVAERLMRFERMDSTEAVMAASRSRPDLASALPSRCVFNTVASRAARFEPRPSASEDQPSPTPPSSPALRQEVSPVLTRAAGSRSSVPDTIPIYFRAEPASVRPADYVRSQPDVNGRDGGRGVVVDASRLSEFDLDRRRSSGVMRQPSYLTAVNQPSNKTNGTCYTTDFPDSYRDADLQPQRRRCASAAASAAKATCVAEPRHRYSPEAPRHRYDDYDQTDSTRSWYRNATNNSGYYDDDDGYSTGNTRHMGVKYVHHHLQHNNHHNPGTYEDPNFHYYDEVLNDDDDENDYGLDYSVPPTQWRDSNQIHAVSDRDGARVFSFNGSGFLSTAHVTLREKTYLADDAERETKLQRRTSYLMATGRQHQVNASGATAALTTTTPTVTCSGDTSIASSVTSGADTSPLTPSPNNTLTTSATKTSNIKKLKAFFGEKTPKVTEALTDRRSQFDISPSSVGEFTIEAALSCKLAAADGKRASDRSWKMLWVALKGSLLSLYRDKSTIVTDDPHPSPIDVKGCMVDIAYDYTKKKNVFRLTTPGGSEFLFQADDHAAMLAWIQALQSSCFPAGDNMDSSALLDAVIRRVAQTPEENAKTSPTPAVKNKKTSSITAKLKSPGPIMRTKKVSTEKTNGEKEAGGHELVESPKAKENKSTWKGRVARHFRRHGSSSSAPGDMPKMAEISGTFGIPLEMCVPGNANPLVPLVVEACIQIVEEKGISNQGIYRVPGNRGAVNQLHDELNKEPECLDMRNERWQDINVVSSLLKLFFRELPDPLITDELYDSVVAANHTEDPTRRMLKIKKLIHDLPEVNFETFHMIARHLNLVAQNEATNKMDARNLAIVFGPTLVRPLEDSMIMMVKDMSDQCRITEMIIQHCQWFFSSWDEDVNVPVSSAAGRDEQHITVTGVNHEMLLKAELMASGVDRNRDVSANAKEFVSSIFHAANKRIRRSRDRTSGGGAGNVGYRGRDSIEPEGASSEPPSYSERNIDHEVELHRLKELLRTGTDCESAITTVAENKCLTENVSSSVTVSSSTSTTASVGIVITSASTGDKSEPGSETIRTRETDNLLLARARRSCFFESNSSVTLLSPDAHDSCEQKRHSVDVGFLGGRPDKSPSPQTDTGGTAVRFTSGADDEVGHQPMEKIVILTDDIDRQMRRLAVDLQRSFQEAASPSARAVERRRINAEMSKIRLELEQQESSVLTQGNSADSKTTTLDRQSVTSDYSTMSSITDDFRQSETNSADFSESRKSTVDRAVRRRVRTEFASATSAVNIVPAPTSGDLTPSSCIVNESFGSDRSDHLSISFDTSRISEPDQTPSLIIDDSRVSEPNWTDSPTEQPAVELSKRPGINPDYSSDSMNTNSVSVIAAASGATTGDAALSIPSAPCLSDGKNPSSSSSSLVNPAAPVCRTAFSSNDRQTCLSDLPSYNSDVNRTEPVVEVMTDSAANAKASAVLDQNVNNNSSGETKSCDNSVSVLPSAENLENVESKKDDKKRVPTFSSNSDFRTIAADCGLRLLSEEAAIGKSSDLLPRGFRGIVRRHTLSGPRDIQLILEWNAGYSASSGSERLSAWQRLQPVVKDRLPDIGAWLAKHRLHHVSSSPALCVGSSASPHIKFQSMI